MNRIDYKSSLKTRANLRQPSAVMCQNLSEWRQNGSLKFLAKPLKSFLERVKGIEPSYSAWKSSDFRNVFKSHSDIWRLSGRLRSLGNFSLSEWHHRQSLG